MSVQVGPYPLSSTEGFQENTHISRPMDGEEYTDHDVGDQRVRNVIEILFNKYPDHLFIGDR